MSAPQIQYPPTSGGGAPVGGSGTSSPSTIPRWTGPSTLGDSVISESQSSGAAFHAFTLQNTQAQAAREYFDVYAVYSGALNTIMSRIEMGRDNATPGNYASMIAFSTRANGGSLLERMRIDPSGFVGIGTASPLAQFTLGGVANSTTKMGFQAASTEVGSITMNSATGEQRITSGFAAWGGFQTFYTNGFERARIDSSGNVGVGMTSGFSGKLGVLSANAISTADMTFSYDATGSYRHGFSNVFSSGTAANNTSTWLVWNAAGGQTQVMTANGAGNVGIGTASPVSALHVRNNTAGITLDSTLGGGRQYQLNPLRTGLSNSGFEIRDVTAGTGVLWFDATQQVGIGTPTPASRLDVAGTITCDDAGTGLKLPATPGNADAQTLDCYAEGTWTPTLNSFTTSGTVTASGKVTRWGRLAIVELTITTGAASSASCTALTSNVTGFSTAPPSDTFNVFATGGVSGTLTFVNAAMVSGGTIYPAAFSLTANQTIKFVFSYTV